MIEDKRYPRRSVRSRWLARWLLVLLPIALGLLFFVPTQYYVTRPGSAIKLAPMIDVEGGVKDEAGSFMLTTVRMGEANLAWYLYSQFSPDAELMEKKLVVSEGETNEDFTRRELAVMENSQKTAEAVAFRIAGYEVKVENKGVWVMGLVEGLPAKKVMKIGDVIVSVDGKPTLKKEDLLSYLSQKKKGESVTIAFLREGKRQEHTLRLAQLPGSKTAGIGIRPEDKQEITIPKKVKIASEGIGGPSAGLMMTLEMYDQLNTDEDLTRGYQIAGTGTISLDGSVGRIGGINHKVVAADKAGAEIFFAPDDQAGHLSNYQEAVATAKRIGTKMQIVPVKTIEDALEYLRTQPEKHS
ncbi:PDZ domain-containing protein [Brevibacillus composti]|uniref:endopeptidase La n=1 Tax=Brevibacillus composti TaxID=2796470 RepID=A0A7T5ENZ5_9BACL|nr:SepM family pheromone-processing serine protease [Brevibacillus composti]QQE76073.1 PDZ domain-containing protein [Brevibacillus composti]QUO43101.1 PDZ domain-containing protein [Brevibacillus composti]